MSQQPPLIPLPATYRQLGEELQFGSPIMVSMEANSSEMSSTVVVCGKMSQSVGGPAMEPLVGIPHGNGSTVHLELVSDRHSKDGEYRFSVENHNLYIHASSKRGLFYGMVSLVQLLTTAPSSDGILLIPGLEIEDYPRFAWRGMHLDVSRHFLPVAFIKKYIDLLAFHKMNVFHWHLTDDQGWRIQIERYPRLTDIGAWRTDAGGERYGGFYTQAEIREIVRYAEERFIAIVPEIELPGHAMAALAAYPEYSCSGGPFEVAGTWGIFDDVYCVGQDATFTFLENVLSEVAELFPGEYIHIGGDECPKVRWQTHELCQQRKEELNLRTEDELQSYFVSRIERHLRSLGKRLVGWDEILDGGAPEGATIMAWRSVEKGIEAALAGHSVVMCPMPHCYFDHYQSLENEPKAIGGHTPLEKVYAFEPIPSNLSPELTRHVIGGQANVWTEYMPNESHVEYMAFPRMCALSEVLWSPASGRNFSDFLERLQTHLRRLDNLNVNYRRLRG